MLSRPAECVVQNTYSVTVHNLNLLCVTPRQPHAPLFNLLPCIIFFLTPAGLGLIIYS